MCFCVCVSVWFQGVICVYVCLRVCLCVSSCLCLFLCRVFVFLRDSTFVFKFSHVPLSFFVFLCVCCLGGMVMYLSVRFFVDVRFHMLECVTVVFCMLSVSLLAYPRLCVCLCLCCEAPGYFNVFPTDYVCVCVCQVIMCVVVCLYVCLRVHVCFHAYLCVVGRFRSLICVCLC